MHKISFLVIVLLLFIFPIKSLSQYPFGKNKVHYTKKDWKVLETEHVDVYHYPSEKDLIVLMAPMIEETYLEYSRLFNIQFRGRMPLIFYSSHYDFQQTNIIPSLISDFTAGFTDLIKGRIAIPFSGSIGSLRHVVKHEMVHAFMIEKLHQVMNKRGKFTYAQPPLWLIEGMAEYIADPNSDSKSSMFVRDALLNDKLPTLENIWRIEGSFMMYKEGEAVVRFISNNFGDEAIIKIMDNWWRSDNLNVILKSTINMNLTELNDAFMKSIKRRYYPAVLSAGFVQDEGKQLTKPRSFHSRPVVLEAGDGRIVVSALRAESGVINISRITFDENGLVSEKTIIEGGRSSAFESIPALRSKMDVKGDTLLFVSKKQASDAVYLWNWRQNKRLTSYSFDNLSVISSPTLSPEGNRIVFSAIDTTGLMDIYLYDISQNKLQRLTDDPYSEDNPDFHPTRNIILFSSDRCRPGVRNAGGLFLMNLDTRDITPLSSCNSNYADPVWSPDGKSILFSSDSDGIFNIYQYRDGSETRQTNVLGGATSPSFLPDGSGFVASCYTNAEFHIFYFPFIREGRQRKLIAAKTDSIPNSWLDEYKNEFNYESRDYKMKLGLDLLGTGIAVDPDFGDIGNGAEMVFTDLMGNHQFYAFIGNSSQGLDDFWKSVNIGITYVNLSRRLNFMLGAFHLTSFWGDYFSLFRSERRYGGVVGASYPFSKFSRAEGTLVVRAVERETDFGDIFTESQSSVLATSFLTYVADNTLWTIGGPLTGTRYYVTSGNTADLLGRGFESTTLHLDLRKYFKLSQRVLLAERFINRNSWGSDLQLFYLGGDWSLRGYDFREFVGRSIYLVNSELRFPLIDHFSLSFPFGTIEMPSFRGAVFFDAGKADRFIADTGWLGAVGVGVELNLGFAPVIRVNFTRVTDFDNISNDTKFGLFIGYNY